MTFRFRRALMLDPLILDENFMISPNNDKYLNKAKEVVLAWKNSPDYPHHHILEEKIAKALKLTEDLTALNAQDVFDRWMAKQPVIYGYSKIDNLWGFTKNSETEYQAKIIDIERIDKKPCEHERVAGWQEILPDSTFRDLFKCKACGKVLKPTEWQEV
jgi:hypothetical protein